jgi:molybdopterin-biosynthesis enzyme MoeA-like protein
VIGDKILSGRTKDKNIGCIADYPTALGIDLKEVRVAGDKERRSSMRSMRPGIATPRIVA